MSVKERNNRVTANFSTAALLQFALWLFSFMMARFSKFQISDFKFQFPEWA
jgi:hypothetical protein